MSGAGWGPADASGGEQLVPPAREQQWRGCRGGAPAGIWSDGRDCARCDGDCHRALEAGERM